MWFPIPPPNWARCLVLLARTNPPESTNRGLGMNLAPIKYADALVSAGGPIERIECARIELNGGHLYHANSWLSRELGLKTRPVELFSTATGSGAAESAMVARHKAISESLERWAYHYLDQIGHRKSYGFDEWPGTTGMAAFPGLFKFQARTRALREAIERACLIKWWDGELNHVDIETGIEGINGITVENPYSGDEVIVLWSPGSNGLTSYGTAAGANQKATLQQAHVELCRHCRALERLEKQYPQFNIGDIASLQNPVERNLIYFSLPDGHAAFLERVHQSPSMSSSCERKPIVDVNIPGPWQRYATVWRVVIPARPSNRSGRNFL